MNLPRFLCFCKKNKEDIYIEILKLGRDHNLEGVTEEDLWKLAYDKSYLTKEEFDEVNAIQPRENVSVPTRRKADAISQLFIECFETVSRGNDPEVRTLNMNSRFQLLEHRELVLARDNAKSARVFSLWAIGIAFASLAASLYFSNQPIQLAETQYQALVRAAPDLTPITGKLDRIDTKLRALIDSNKPTDSQTEKQNLKLDTLPQKQ